MKAGRLFLPDEIVRSFFRENGSQRGPKIMSVWCGHTLRRTTKVLGLNPRVKVEIECIFYSA